MPGRSQRLHSIGVSDSDTKPDTSTAAMMVTANSCSSLPSTPPMNSTGMNTAASDSVMETMVKPTSRAPSSVACIGVLPISRWRLMFSSMTMASSTTKPTHSVSAIRERLSRLKPIRYITENVPTIDIGSDRLGISVAERLRRNRKITSTTRASASNSVNCTSSTDSRMDWERS